jgi:C4-dicarboxylate-specific signal transduction histidine kinase
MARRDVIVLSQLVIFSVIAANDIGLILGLNSSVPLLPVGLFAVLFLAIISVERQISQTYVERDYLRQNLEAEVKIKTKSLEDALKRLQVAQAEVVQSAKLAGLGTLAAGIAHEINNSLNYVNGSLLPLSRLIERSSMETEPKQKAQRLLQVMGSGLQLTAKIISNLKSYAHAGGEREHVDVREVIEGILAILKSKLSVGIDVILDVEPGLQVFADRVALSQILMNLTDNAIDALVTLEGDRRLVFAGGQSGKDAVWLSLTDNGPGIPENILTNIYDPFFTTKPVGKGTGLGLYIVKNEISKCGGTIEIHSRTADVQGTQFVMTFPSAAIKDEAA